MYMRRTKARRKKRRGTMKHRKKGGGCRARMQYGENCAAATAREARELTNAKTNAYNNKCRYTWDYCRDNTDTEEDYDDCVHVKGC